MPLDEKADFKSYGAPKRRKRAAWSAANIALHLTLFASCQSPKGSSLEEPIHQEGTYQPKELQEEPLAELERKIQTLPGPIKEKIACREDTLFEHLARAPKRGLQWRLENTLPYFLNYPLPLKERSPYDGFELPYTFFCPQEPKEAKAIVLCLADQHETWPVALQQLPVFYLQIPSRPKMSYQLLAEGDFWHCLDAFYELYPELKTLPLLLAAEPAYADAALLMGNQSRYRFSGLAFSGGLLGAQLKNLDYLPIAHYSLSHSKSPEHLFSGGRLIGRLQKRGNLNAYAVEGDLNAAIAPLLNIDKPLDQASYAFEDYRYAQAWDWLKVTCKKNEEEPSFISYQIKEGELELTTSNVSSFEINGSASSFLKGIKRLRYNNRLIAFSKNIPSVRIGDEDLPEHVHRKSSCPPGMHNFYSLEPLFIVYQTKKGAPKYLEAVAETASLFAKLSFKGFPYFSAELPQIPLEEYNPEELPKHRALFIGQEEAIEPFFADNFPLQIGREGVLINHKRVLPKQAAQKIAYGLQYPPGPESPLSLAFALVASDEKGLKSLADHYLSPANLYRQMDFCLFNEQRGRYRLAKTLNFDGYFGSSYIPEVLFNLPKTDQESWERFLRQELAKTYQTPYLAVGPLTSDHLAPPTEISYSEIARFLPAKNFIKVTVDSEAKPLLEKYSLLNLSDLDKASLKEILVKETSSRGAWHLKPERCQQTFPLLVEETRLLALPTHLLNKLKIEVMPFDLQEITLKAFHENGLVAGQQILKFEQPNARRSR